MNSVRSIQIGLSVDEVQEKFTLLDEFQDVFKGLGCVEGEYNIKLKGLIVTLLSNHNGMSH